MSYENLVSQDLTSIASYRSYVANPPSDGRWKRTQDDRFLT